MKRFAFAFWLFLAAPAFAAEAPDPASFAGKSEMNGYTYRRFAGFEKKWKLVTVRYRKDTGEQRFTYANPKAWATLETGKKEFPDGAVFAKIGFATEPDPAFPSSAVPSGARRTQFMVRDQKKHADTDGWGYALFDENERTFPEDPYTKTQACAACHRLVPERGFVFSEVMYFAGKRPVARSLSLSLRLKFESVPLGQIPVYLRARLPEGTKSVRLLTGELRKHLFQGTLDEIRPTLADECLRSGLPAILLSESEKQYSLAYLATEAAPCAGDSEVPMRGEHNLFSDPEKRYELSFCHAAAVSR